MKCIACSNEISDETQVTSVEGDDEVDDKLIREFYCGSCTVSFEIQYKPIALYVTGKLDDLKDDIVFE